MNDNLHKHTTFITGATGFIAHELIKCILEHESSGDLYVLIRGSKEHSATSRFHQVLKELGDGNDAVQYKNLTERMYLVEGDITKERFGLKTSDYQELAKKINRMYHVAASVHLTGNLDKMLKTNVHGTKTVLDFAVEVQNHRELDLFNYVSTAYVAGKRKGVIYENELIKNQKFNNNYEHAKYKAEVLVRDYAKRLPIVIYRPSIVMGHSVTGWTKTFNVLYEPMKMLYFGRLRFAPADKSSIVDIVPVDYVAKGIYHISTQKQKALFKTFHLCTGKGKSSSFPLVVKKITDSLFKWSDYYEVDNPKKSSILLQPLLFKSLSKILYVFSSKRQKRKILKMLTYTDYVAITKEFDASSAEQILKPMGIVCPEVDSYLDILCHYAVKTHFGMSDKPENIRKK